MNIKKFYDAANEAEARVQKVAAQINDLFDAGKTEEALALRVELDKAKADAKAANELYLSMKAATSGDSNPAQRFIPAGANNDPEPEDVKKMRASNEYSQQFWNAFKSGVTPKTILNGQHNPERFGLLMNALSETGGTPAGSEGGFLNPVDFDNMIHERMRQFIDLAVPQYFNIENVTAYSGWRDIETTTAESAFSKLTELDVLADGEETESPKFTKVEYTIEDYGGFLRISNSLLSDTPVNIMAYLSRWFGKKVVLTNNSLLLALINALTPTAITDLSKLLGAIKTVLNKTLDPAISARATIFTNQSGFDLLDQLVDGTGRPLLKPDPTNETTLRLLGREIVRLSDAHWANLSGPARARIAIGDGTEFATFFRREAFEMATTNIGGSAWRSNSSEARGIMRADAVGMDSGAMALLTVAIPS